MTSGALCWHTNLGTHRALGRDRLSTPRCVGSLLAAVRHHESATGSSRRVCAARDRVAAREHAQGRGGRRPPTHGKGKPTVRPLPRALRRSAVFGAQPPPQPPQPRPPPPPPTPLTLLRRILLPPGAASAGVLSTAHNGDGGTRDGGPSAGGGGRPLLCATLEDGRDGGRRQRDRVCSRRHVP